MRERARAQPPESDSSRQSPFLPTCFRHILLTDMAPCSSTSAMPVVSPTRTTASAFSDAAQEAVEVTKPPVKRTGKQLWKKAKVKLHMYHAVSHEFQHRAQEKVGFAVAEAVLTRATAYAVQAAQEPALTQASVKLGKRWWAKARNALQGIGRKLRLRKITAIEASHAVGHHAHHAAHPTGLLGHGLHATHIAMPVLGTYLLAHMAHHDWHRALSEWRQHKLILTTTLFVFAAFWDAIDALAHLVVVLCLVLPETAYFNHHVEHTMHEYSMIAALIACTAMMLGEAIAVRWHGHDDHHADAKPKFTLEAVRKLKVA